MKNVMRKIRMKSEHRPESKSLRAVHDIIKLMEVNHFKVEMALTEIKVLCLKPKKK